MPTGTQLLSLVQMLRLETGRSGSVAVGVDDLDALKHLLKRTQDTLYIKHDWVHLKQVFNRIPLQAGDRYYDFPDEFNFDRIINVGLWYNGIPQKIDRGIGFGEYATYDSEADERADPVARWDVRWTGTEAQCEVWPIPATNDQELQFIGIRKLRALTANADVCDLDDFMIVLYAAAELLAKADPDSAKLKLAMGKARFDQLKVNAGNNGQRFVMGSGQAGAERGRAVVRVAR
jgi:hypothetical protein